MLLKTATRRFRDTLQNGNAGSQRHHFHGPTGLIVATGSLPPTSICANFPHELATVTESGRTPVVLLDRPTLRALRRPLHPEQEGSAKAGPGRLFLPAERTTASSDLHRRCAGCLWRPLG